MKTLFYPHPYLSAGHCQWGSAVGTFVLHPLFLLSSTYAGNNGSRVGGQQGGGRNTARRRATYAERPRGEGLRRPYWQPEVAQVTADMSRHRQRGG